MGLLFAGFGLSIGILHRRLYGVKMDQKGSFSSKGILRVSSSIKDPFAPTLKILKTSNLSLLFAGLGHFFCFNLCVSRSLIHKQHLQLVEKPPA